MAECPDENALLDLVSGAPSPEVSAHVAQCPTCSLVIADAFGAPATPPLATGSTLGRYRIVCETGRGAAGTVYEALDEMLDRAVAIKVLHRSTADSRDRFLREARLLAKLEHANVVAIHDAGDVDGLLYFAMDLVRGKSVRELVATSDKRELLRVLRDAGRGLAAAHHAGIVHRDFKPANVLVAESGRVLVVDFGLAATVEDRATEIAGTPAYMPPEQIDGRETDARSDQFAFCASLVHVLSGKLPFGEAKTLGDLREAIEQQRFDPGALAALPARVRRVVTRGLRAKPDERWPSMDAVLRALDGRSRVIGFAVAGAVIIAVAGIVAGRAIASGGSSESSSGGASASSGGGASRSAADACVVAIARLDEAMVPSTREPRDAPWSSIVRGPDAPWHAELETWTTQWRTAREAICRTTPGTDPHADREALCLDGQLVDLGATIDLVTVDGVTTAEIARAMTMLPPPALCHGKRLPPMAKESRTERTEMLQQTIAVLQNLGPKHFTMLVGMTPRLAHVRLPDGKVTDEVPVAYDGDLWELRQSGDQILTFDRKTDTLVAIAPDGKTTPYKIEIDIHHNGRGIAFVPGYGVVALDKGRELVAIAPVGTTTKLSTLDDKYQLETMVYCDDALYAAASTGPGNAAGRILVTIDLKTGAVTERGVIGDAIDIDVLACDSKGQLFGIDTIDLATNDLWMINRSTGARIRVAVLPGPVNGLLAE